MYFLQALKKGKIMRYLYVFIVLFIFRAEAQISNFDERDFFKRVRDSYYCLSEENVNNFTALVTNVSIEEFAKELWNNAEIFPIQMIWFAPDRLFLSQQGVPTLPKDKYGEYQQQISALNQQVKGILMDLQRFFFRGIYNSLHEDYQLSFDDDQTVVLSYVRGSGPQETDTKYYFGLNGMCIKIEMIYPSQNKRVITLPRFRAVKTKWLCTGWSIQTIDNDEVSGGYIISLKNKVVNDLWVPINIQIEVQKSDRIGETFSDIIKIRNYLFNQPIEYINKPKKGD
jgi:hypothetical protein